MAHGIQITTACLNGIIAFSLLYGIYFDLFLGSLYVLVYRKRTRKVNYVILGGTILQFVLITIYYGIRWYRIYTAFITNGNQPNGPLLFFAKLNDWREVSTLIIWAITSALGDIMFIYRLYFVWDRQYLPCVIPFILLIGSLTATTGLFVVLNKRLTTDYTTSLTHWGTAVLSFNLAQNILVTLLITARIWRVNIRTAKLISGSGLRSVTIILLESGAFYSSSVLVFLVIFTIQSNADMIMVDIVLPIMGITFNLIIVRVYLGLSRSGYTVDQTAGTLTHPTSGMTFARSTRGEKTNTHFVDGTSGSEPYPLRDLAETSTSHDDTEIRTASGSYEYP